jgi:hypothetical protein
MEIILSIVLLSNHRQCKFYTDRALHSRDVKILARIFFILDVSTRIQLAFTFHKQEHLGAAESAENV